MCLPAQRRRPGYWLDVEPVENASKRNPQSVSDAVRKSIGRSEAVVPTPLRGSFPEPVVLSHTDNRSWSAFEKKAFSQISIIRSVAGTYSFERYRPAVGGIGVEVDTELVKASPLAGTLDDAITELLRLMSADKQ